MQNRRSTTSRTFSTYGRVWILGAALWSGCYDGCFGTGDDGDGCEPYRPGAETRDFRQDEALTELRLTVDPTTERVFVARSSAFGDGAPDAVFSVGADDDTGVLVAAGDAESLRVIPGPTDRYFLEATIQTDKGDEGEVKEFAFELREYVGAEDVPNRIRTLPARPEKRTFTGTGARMMLEVASTDRDVRDVPATAVDLVTLEHTELRVPTRTAAAFTPDGGSLLVAWVRTDGAAPGDVLVAKISVDALRRGDVTFDDEGWTGDVEVSRVLRSDISVVDGLTFSPDGRRVAVAMRGPFEEATGESWFDWEPWTSFARWSVLDVASLVQVAAVDAPHSYAAGEAPVFSPDGEVLAVPHTTFSGVAVTLLDLNAETRETVELRGADDEAFGGVPRCAFEPSGARLFCLSPGDFPRAAVVDMATATPTAVDAPTDLVLDRMMDRPGAGEVWLASAFALHRFSWETLAIEPQPIETSAEVMDVVLLPAHDVLAALFSDYRIGFYAPEDLSLIREVEIPASTP